MKLKKIVTSKKPEIIEIKIRPNQKIIPKLQFGNPIEDLSPLLNRKEFQNNMDLAAIKSDKKIFEAN
jgi:acetolactate synthase-1/2/3 large subunit